MNQKETIEVEGIIKKINFKLKHGNNLKLIAIEGKFGLIDCNGRIIQPIEYDYIGELNNGLAVAKLRGKYGFLDKDGNVAISFNLEFAASFSEGLAPVKNDKLWGFIDEGGELVINYQWDEIKHFSYNHAIVCKNGKYGIINKEGKIILGIDWDKIEYSEERGKRCYIVFIIKDPNKAYNTTPYKINISNNGELWTFFEKKKIKWNVHSQLWEHKALCGKNFNEIIKLIKFVF